MKPVMCNERISLSGQWKLLWTDGQRGRTFSDRTAANYASDYMDTVKWLDAEVPGEVHQDLIRAGILQEPSTGLNVLSARWVEECIWFYRRTFVVPAEVLGSRAWLYFAGLDYSAKIFVNGREAGEHENFYRPCRIEVTELLREGENILTVQLDSGLFSVSEKPIKDFFLTSYDTLLTKRLWLRKPQSSFSWDWSPRLLNVGIHGDVWLEWADAVLVDTVAVRTDVNADYSQGTVHVTATVEGLLKEGVAVQVVLERRDTGEVYKADASVAEGIGKLELSAKVSAPRLWWPIGQGEPYLYPVTVRILVQGRICYEQEKRVGFRHVRLNQDPLPEGGSRFVFEINGRPVFMKGANWVPADLIYARIDRVRYEELLRLAVEANFNTLRVWGGGLYESDDFYELCDRHGLMVWQDFIFACGSYPGYDAAFRQNVKEEAVFQVRRLAEHPSHVIWCGNNEIEQLTWDRDSGIVNGDYELYHRLLPQIVRSEDPGKLYVPSSPFSPDYEHPNKDDTGDQHPWSVGINSSRFYEYRNMICRFPNEGGYLGPTSLGTMQASLPEGHEYIHSLAWQIHDNCVETWYDRSQVDKMLSDWIGRDPRAMPIAEYVYYGGLIQGEALREYIDNFRRRKFGSAAAIFWMYNDCWPATRSWTIVDYYLSRTPSYYPVKRAFSPVSVVISEEDGMLKVYGVNDTDSVWQGEVRYGIFSLDGETIIQREAQAEIPANQSVVLAEFPLADLKMELTQRAAFAELLQDGRLTARNRLMLAVFHEMDWAPAEVSVRRDGLEIVFSCDVFAWGVCLDLNGRESLPDNFFDVWPRREYRLAWPEDRPLPLISHVGNLVEE